MQPNPMDLTGRRILVTGASSGLGRATAVAVARMGAKVLIAGRNSERLEQTLKSLSGSGHQMRAFDLTDWEALSAHLRESASSDGRFAGAVHCAGLDQTKPLKLTRPGDFEEVYRINVVAAAMLLQAISRRDVMAPDMCSVVLVGSVLGLVGAAGRTAYASSKGAVLALTRSAALELAPHVRVNALLPGYVETEMTHRQAKLLGPEQLQQIRDMHPLGLGQPDDIAYAAAFLLSDAARWITGAALTVDGGYTAR